MSKPEPHDLIGDDTGVQRCWWCGSDPLYVAYHDWEWGRPVYDDIRLFEKLCLEGFQAGLSWLTILRKREAFRHAFAGFNFERIARFTKRDVERLLKNEGIVRHRGKIESTIQNARQAMKMLEKENSLADYFWQFRPQQRQPLSSRQEILATSPESTQLSKDLKRRGWTFVGPTTCYAFMQAMGMVNDHLVGCHVWQEIQKVQ